MKKPVVSDAALAWLERSLQQSLRDQLQEQASEAELQVQAAEALYRGGRGAQADVFAARTEVELLRDRIEQTERAMRLAGTQLARWIGEAAQRPGGPRPVLALPAWADEHLEGPAMMRLAEHLATHPQIAAAVQQERLAQADVAVARAERQADWSAELTYSQRGPAFSNMVSLNFSLPLPWGTRPRQEHELAAALALAERAGAEREERERAHRTEVGSMLQEWRGDEQRLARYDTHLLPLARQRSEAALAAYRAGSGPLAALLQARRAELDVHTQRLGIEMDIARLWAGLNYLIPQTDAGPAAPAARSQP